MVIIVIALAVLLIIGIVFLTSYKINKKFLLDRFNEGNVIVAGKKGKGKDLLFQYVINNRKQGIRGVSEYTAEKIKEEG